MPTQLEKESWISQFISELQSLRPEMGSGKYANLVAEQQWRSRQDMPPRDAARAWVEESGAVRGS